MTPAVTTESKSIDQIYLEIKRPRNLVKDMSFDDFCDWCDKGTREDLEAALVEFEKDNLPEHCRIIKYKLGK